MRIEWDDTINMTAEAYTISSYAFRKKMTFTNYMEYIKGVTNIQMTRDTISSIAVQE